VILDMIQQELVWKKLQVLVECEGIVLEGRGE
jgi:hypothetical protein